MIVVLLLQFVMPEMLADFTQERGGRGNQIFEPSTFCPVGYVETHALISAHVWSWFDASFTMIWVIQITHGVPKNFQQLHLPKQGPELKPLTCEISKPLRAWMQLYHIRWGLHGILVFFLFQVDHFMQQLVWASIMEIAICLWMRPCLYRNLYVKGTHLERDQSWCKLVFPVHTIGHSSVGRQLEKRANGVIHEKGVIVLNSTIKHEFSTFCMNKTIISSGIRRYIIERRKHLNFGKKLEVLYTWTKAQDRLTDTSRLFYSCVTMTGVYMER